MTRRQKFTTAISAVLLTTSMLVSVASASGPDLLKFPTNTPVISEVKESFNGIEFKRYAQLEYSIDGEQWEGRLGFSAEYGQWTLTPSLISTYDNTDELEYSGLETVLQYKFNDMFTAYGELTIDDSLNNSDTVLGVRVNF